MGYHSSNSSFEALNCKFHGQKIAVQEETQCHLVVATLRCALSFWDFGRVVFHFCPCNSDRKNREPFICSLSRLDFFGAPPLRIEFPGVIKFVFGNKRGLGFLKGYLTGMVVEAELKLIKYASAPEDIEADSNTFRESNRSGNSPISNLNREIVNIGWDKAPVPYNNHLGLPFLPVNAKSICFICLQDGEHGSRVNIDPDPVAKNRNWNDWQQVTFVRGVREFYKRQAISSSRGTRSTDGILCGSIS